MNNFLLIKVEFHFQTWLYGLLFSAFFLSIREMLQLRHLYDSAVDL